MNERKRYMLARVQKGITQTEIAKNIKCSQTLLSLYEKGNANMSQEKLKKYQDYIDNFASDS